MRNPFYKGSHLVFRTHQKGIRSNIYDIIPREEWEIIENCHEATVSLEEWEKVQELAKTALKGADAFYQRLSSRMEHRCMADASQMQKERKRLEVRNREIDEMFLNLYTDKAKGILFEQRFVKLTATM